MHPTGSAAPLARRARPTPRRSRSPPLSRRRPRQPARGRLSRGRLEDSLRSLQTARDDYERAATAARAALDDEHKARIRAIASDFPVLWADPATPQRERKRMVCLLIEDVTLAKGDQIHAHVRFRGGQTTTLAVPIPPTAWQARQTHPDTLAALDRLLDDHTDAEVAELLDRDGHRSGEGKAFTGRIVLHLRRAHQLPSHAERLRAAGMLTLTEMAERLDVYPRTIKCWHQAGLITGHKANDKNVHLYAPPAPAIPGSSNAWAGASRSDN